MFNFSVFNIFQNTIKLAIFKIKNTPKAIAENMIKAVPLVPNQANTKVTKIHQNSKAENWNKIFVLI